MYMSYLLPVVDYASVVWDGCSQRDSQTLQKIQAFYIDMFSCIVFCNISKAFDRVWHQDRSFKLMQNGMEGKL